MAGVLTASWAGGGDGADGREVDSIAKVVVALEAIRAASAAAQPRMDGIAAFSDLYGIITRNVLETADGTGGRRFADTAFLTELDLQFARRYLAAIRQWETDAGSAPRCWRILFDARGPGRDANYAAAGVNAHVNFDLALALLETWRRFPPNPERRSDYDLVNDIFSQEMDDLRERFHAGGAVIGPDGNPVDRATNMGSSILVRWTRGFAWDAAHEVWQRYDPARQDGGRSYQWARRILEWSLDGFAHTSGTVLLDLDAIP